MTTAARAHQTSETATLRTVVLHRPGPELERLTPRNNADLLFDGIPWVGRAQEEHDGFAQALRDRDVEVLYLARAAGGDPRGPRGPQGPGRGRAGRPRLGPSLAKAVEAHLEDLDAARPRAGAHGRASRTRSSAAAGG